MLVEISTLKEFSGFKGAEIGGRCVGVGDVLVLPIDGFATGGTHSGAARGWALDNAMTRHLFSGSWREN